VSGAAPAADWTVALRILGISFLGIGGAFLALAAYQPGVSWVFGASFLAEGAAFLAAGFLRKFKSKP
jgi:hypothetical protein